MKTTLFFILLGLTLNTLYAQKTAITGEGKEVVLYDNGTWKYTDEEVAASAAIKINDEKFEKSNKSTFLVKSNKVNVGIFIDPKKWAFSKGEEGEVSEYKFKLRDGDLYAMLVAERTPIPVESLRGIAIQNARNAAPDVSVIHEEYRNVNGIEVLAMQMGGTIQGIKFRYYGYYYSNNNGTIQFLTYTSENLFEENLKEIELILNGLVERD